jgi:oxygen-independent coproporphyrinogen-3 oxidase
VLDDESRRVERVLLEMRLRDGLARDVLDAPGLAAVPLLVADGLLEPGDGPLVLTLRGRLLADAVVRDLLP